MIHKKRLISHTIIPADLYVERNADSQLRREIEEMGRPPYILVARQMGKTNLLLHAKRSFDGGSDLFQYVDVSNLYPDVTSFFQTIVDLTIGSAGDLCKEAEERIRVRRTASTGAAHREHEWELRELLRCLPGRLIICLDEIDALGKTSYSDEIFSFIRSVYFAGRVNVPEFARLTYVLSGVAEPSEIIKNKDISPFNIGQKIYLDDFTRSEFNSFLTKAGLQLAESVGDRIYYWTNGNPRMTWDVCSVIEDAAVDQPVDIDFVDDLVNKLYLTSFDVPPIDHIRTLVENEREIRDALISIHDGRVQAVPAATRNKLYLRGIVRFGNTNDLLAIRNRILEAALTGQWLREVESTKLSIYERALKSGDEGRWTEAIALYDEFLQSTSIEKDEALVRFQQARCYFALGDYVSAIASINKKPFAKQKTPGYYFAEQYELGRCYLLKGDMDNAELCLRDVLSQDPTDDDTEFYFDALVTLASLLVNRDFQKYGDEVFEMCSNALAQEERIRLLAKGNRSKADQILTVAHYTLALLFQKREQRLAAIEAIEEALKISDPRYMVGLFLFGVKHPGDEKQKARMIEMCVEYIIANQLPITNEDKQFPLDFTLKSCVEIVGYATTQENWDLLRRFLDYLSHGVEHRVPLSLEAIQVQAGIWVLNSGARESAAKLLRDAFLDRNTPGGRGSADRRILATFALFLNDSKDIEALESQYVEEYWVPEGATLVDTDFRILYGLVEAYLPANVLRPRALLTHVERILDDYCSSSDSTKTRYFALCRLIVRCLKCEVSYYEGAKEVLFQETQNILRELPLVKGVTPPMYFAEDLTGRLTDSIRSIQREISSADRSVVRGKKYGRNEIVAVRFSSGKVARGKYKTFLNSLEQGEAELIIDDGHQPPT